MINKNEIVVLSGIPGSGKSTLSRDRFAGHKRINLDTLRSRNKEHSAILTALRNFRSIVIDNTNTTRRARRKYIDIARSHSVPIRAVYIKCPLELALKQNAARRGREYVPEKAIRMYHRIFEVPTVEEGFESVECFDRSESLEISQVKQGATTTSLR